jgi:5-methylcytosine-specific restriction endonuclease McrA
MIIHGHTSIDLPTLVLNKSWYPIDAVTVRDAMCGIMAERAKVSGLSSFRMHSGDEDYDLYDADEWLRLPLLDNEPYIQATHQRIRIPEVIINRHHKVPSRDVKFSRINLWKRDSWTCQYCGKMPENDEITIDHVVPRSRGGKTTFGNTVLAWVA